MSGQPNAQAKSIAYKERLHRARLEKKRSLEAKFEETVYVSLNPSVIQNKSHPDTTQCTTQRRSQVLPVVSATKCNEVVIDIDLREESESDAFPFSTPSLYANQSTHEVDIESSKKVSNRYMVIRLKRGDAKIASFKLK
jgi:hypothetical protein